MLPSRQVLIPHPSILRVALLLLLTSYAEGQSLEFSPRISYRTYQVVLGERARVHCVLKGGGDSQQSFNWTGPAIANTRATTNNSQSSSTFTIERVQKKDGGEYRCSYSGLVISFTLNVVFKPGFLNVQERQAFTEGTDAVVECPAFFGNNSEARMIWFHNNVTIQSNQSYYPQKGSLIIRNIHRGVNGTNYTCSLLKSGAVSGSKTIRVDVLPQSEFAPRIDDSERNTEVVLGKPLNLSCRLKQHTIAAAVTYSWTIDTKFEHAVLINTSANLQLEAHRFLGGIYTCRAENEFGYDIADFSVKILAAPLPSNCLTTTNIRALGPGTTAVLKYCELTSPVELRGLTFNWKRVEAHNGSEVLVDVRLEGRSRISIHHNGWLIIENIERSDLGVYKVNISNEMGYALNTVSLELVEVTSSPVSLAQAQTHNLSQFDGVPINMKFEVQDGSLRCHDIKERIQDFIQRHLFDEFGFADVAFEAPIVNCASESKVGTFKASLRGRNAHMLVAQVNQRGISDLTLNNGHTLRLEICTNVCSLEDSTNPISIVPGGVIAATFVSVVVAGAILLMVILVRYRRRSLVKYTDEEQVVPLKLSDTLQPGHLTKQGPKSVAKQKPVYGRSFSLTFPITSS